MAVPYHTHKFEIPAASKADIEAGSRDDVVATPAALGSAAVRPTSYFATAAEGELAATAVQSVNGKQGKAIVLDKSDIGLGNVDNVSDYDKPVSEATRRALKDKADRRELGSAAFAQAEGFASAEQGRRADAAVQSGDPRLIPPGGVAGAVLVKSGSADYALQWTGLAAATAISYTPQQLDAAQQAQARRNIGAAAWPLGSVGQYMRGDGTLATLNSESVGLGQVNNVADDDKPISKAVKHALAGKVSLAKAEVIGDLRLYQGAYYSSVARGNIAFGQDNYGGSFNSCIGESNTNLKVSLKAKETVGTMVWAILTVSSGSDTSHFSFGHNGSFHVPGTLSKASGTFLIDHPLYPATKKLRHGFAEAPEYLNIYRGEMTLEGGSGKVVLDEYFNMSRGTFSALNGDIIVSGLQNLDSFDRVKPVGTAVNGVLEIICENPLSNDRIAWIVSGRRRDAFVVNLDPNCDRGTGNFVPEFSC